jgi:hypothetical protein
LAGSSELVLNSPACQPPNSPSACILAQIISYVDQSKIESPDDIDALIRLGKRVATSGTNSQRKTVLQILNRLPEKLPENKPFPVPGTSLPLEYKKTKALLLATLGETSTAFAILNALKNQGACFPVEDKPNMEIVDVLAYLGELDAAKDFMKQTLNMTFKECGHQISGFGFHAQGPEGKLIMEYLLRDDQKDALDVYSMLVGKNAFTEQHDRAIEVSPKDWAKLSFYRYYKSKGMEQQAKDMASPLSLVCANLDWQNKEYEPQKYRDVSSMLNCIDQKAACIDEALESLPHPTKIGERFETSGVETRFDEKFGPCHSGAYAIQGMTMQRDAPSRSATSAKDSSSKDANFTPLP